ncbi:sensor histidine kinase [Nocardioides dongxiaopingii]|uniref:sensor histidine kinase n=1 Tax=Nocardioides dongxiaopingii TaxID=2576036 RepID=UPI0010C76913|nr:histidine kinase [Nocardioides dongxiaopingii]
MSAEHPVPARVLVAGGWVVVVVLLGGVTLLAGLAPGAVPDEPRLGWWELSAGFVAVTLQAWLLQWRSLSPARTLVLASAVVPAAAAAGLGAATGVTTVAVLVAAYVVVVECPWPRPVPALVTSAVLVATGEVVRAATGEGLSPGAAGAAVLQGASTVVLAAVVGAVVATRREAARARLEGLRAAAGEQVALTQAAVARQRTAMARELHDIAAHHLSGIAVMTAALDRQIDTDPEGAKQAVREVRHQSTAMLKDLRNLVALLRDDEPGEVRGVEPETLGSVQGLVEGARRAGRDVELSLLGTDAAGLGQLDVGPLAQLAAYRTVQESLSNAARHAPGARCEVVIDARDPRRVDVTVRNGPPSAPTPAPAAGPHRGGGGFGLVGMRERAELTDARLVTGPSADGGFLVALTLPTSTSEEQP